MAERSERLHWRPHDLAYWAEHDVISSLGFTARGILTELFDIQWRVGYLVADLAMIQRKIRATDAEWGEIAEHMDDLFPVCSDGFRRNLDLGILRADQERKVQARRENGQKGGRPKKPEENQLVNQTETNWLTKPEPSTKPNQNQLVNQTETSLGTECEPAWVPACPPDKRLEIETRDEKERNPPPPPLNLVVNHPVLRHSEDGLPRAEDGSLTPEGEALAQWNRHLALKGRSPMTIVEVEVWLMKAAAKEPGWLPAVVEHSISRRALHLYEPPSPRESAPSRDDLGEIHHEALEAAREALGGVL